MYYVLLSHSRGLERWVEGSVEPSVGLIIREEAQSLVITADKIIDKGVRWSYTTGDPTIPLLPLLQSCFSKVAGTGPVRGAAQQ